MSSRKGEIELVWSYLAGIILLFLLQLEEKIDSQKIIQYKKEEETILSISFQIHVFHRD